eukprot:5809333-Pleurochrysis_carterae.AAC.1
MMVRISLAVCPKMVCNLYYLSQNDVQSGIGGLRQKSDGNPIRRVVQTPKCIRAWRSPLLFAFPSLAEADIS